MQQCNWLLHIQILKNQVHDSFRQLATCKQLTTYCTTASLRTTMFFLHNCQSADGRMEAPVARAMARGLHRAVRTAQRDRHTHSLVSRMALARAGRLFMNHWVWNWVTETVNENMIVLWFWYDNDVIWGYTSYYYMTPYYILLQHLQHLLHTAQLIQSYRYCCSPSYRYRQTVHSTT